MANIASATGLKPVNLVGGGPFQGGTIRMFPLFTNAATGFFNGQIISIGVNGQPLAAAATPTTGSAGVVGVCTGVSYVSPTGEYRQDQYLPANAITAGYTDVQIMVNDDPNIVMQIQGTTAYATAVDAQADIGSNAPVAVFTGDSATGNSQMSLTNGSAAATQTLAFRIMGFVPGTETDTFPEILVKFNFGVHSYTKSAGI